MKRAVRAIFCLVVMALAATAGSTASQAQESAGATGAQTVPRAVLPFYSYHFGDVVKGEPILFIFPIKNVGNANLKIKDYKADCACTIVKTDDVIPAGAEGKAVVMVDTANQFYQIIKTATLRTNDPDQPNISLTITANILSNADGSPIKGVSARAGKHIGPIFLGPGDYASPMTVAGRKVKTEFTISAERGPVKVLRVEGDQSHMAFRVEAIEEGKKYKIVVESIPTDAPGIYEANLLIFTDSPALQSYPVAVKLQVYPRQ